MSVVLDGGRHELKYVVPVSARATILAAIEEHTQPDPHGALLPNGGRGYTVRSIYFDTDRFDDYFGRLANRKVRDRLRVRTYGTQDEAHPVFLENKRKLEDKVVKQRTRGPDANSWCSGNEPHPWRLPEQGLAGRQFEWLIEDGRRRPVTLVIYEREVHTAPDGARLTLDLDVRAAMVHAPQSMFEEATVRLIPETHMVLELKFNLGCPAWMRALCRDLELRAEPFSKFALSVALLHRPSATAELRALLPSALRNTSRDAI